VEVKRVFLVGFMCSGKTTVGKLLARALDWDFVDVDSEIEKREGLSIPQIFEKKGEGYFRKLEIKTLKGLSERKDVVIATGGGLGANPQAMEFMKEKGLVVWLKVSYQEFMKRCAGDGNRPMLKKGEEFLKKLMEEREKVYSKAHLRIEETCPEKAVELILGHIKGEGLPH